VQTWHCFWVLALGLAVGCRAESPAVISVEPEFAASPGSGEPNLHATSDGRVILTWLEPANADLVALRLAVREAGTWSEPQTVIESDRFFVNWADFPSLIALDDGSWLVHWLEKVPGSTYAYHVQLALSHDDGATWSGSFKPHRDDSPQEHGFVSMAPLEGGSAALVWLDGRAMGSAGHGAEHDLDRGEMSLRATSITSDGELGPDVLLDSRTCDCCQTGLVRTKAGLVAAYRDRSEEEIRNIAIVRNVQGAWTDPVHVADDDWYYPGCPVNGPQLSAQGDTVAVAWFTAPERQPAVNVAYSFDSGHSFGPPLRVDAGDPIGRVDIELLSSGSAVVSWIERAADAARVNVRKVGPDGSLGAVYTVSETTGARSSGFPRLAVIADEVVVAWTAADAGGVVRTSALRLLN
jgi:hypothetical protein